MKESKNKREYKSAVIEDMMSCITYIPNRELDILAFMEQYQKSDGEHRPAVLECLRSCMEGGEYPNPYEGSYRYNAEDVNNFKSILDRYEENVCAVKGNSAAISEYVQEAVYKINELNEQCGQVLIDSWRWERVCDFIDLSAKEAGAEMKADTVLSHRIW